MAAPDGSILKRAATDAEELVLVDVESGALDRVRTEWPFLRDRRIDAYSDINRRFIDDE